MMVVGTQLLLNGATRIQSVEMIGRASFAKKLRRQQRQHPRRQLQPLLRHWPYNAHRIALDVGTTRTILRCALVSRMVSPMPTKVPVKATKGHGAQRQQRQQPRRQLQQLQRRQQVMKISAVVCVVARLRIQIGITKQVLATRNAGSNVIRMRIVMPTTLPSGRAS
jgi:hypothetical protein